MRTGIIHERTWSPRKAFLFTSQRMTKKKLYLHVIESSFKTPKSCACSPTTARDGEDLSYMYMVGITFILILCSKTDEVDRFTRINRNMFKPPVREEVKDLVRQNFTREIEFYQFCRQRLHRQLLALRLPSAHSGA